jgi:CheY-like chemotaxis protein
MTPLLKSILYVEDDLHVRTTAKLVLEILGKFDVRACSSGPEALHAARDFCPDLILLDVMMPGMDGVGTLEMLRRMPHLVDTPALFITSLTAPEDVARYVQAGAIGVIPKPIVPLRLTGQLHDLWSAHEVKAPPARKSATLAGA